MQRTDPVHGIFNHWFVGLSHGHASRLISNGGIYSHYLFFLMFELSLILAGVLAYKAGSAHPAVWEHWPARLLAPALFAVLFAYPVLLGDWPAGTFFSPARMGRLLLVAVALPAIHDWSRTSTFDRSVGELSYPLYLSHFLVLGVLPASGVMVSHPSLRTLAVTLVSLGLSWLVTRVLEADIEARRLAACAGMRAETVSLAPRSAEMSLPRWEARSPAGRHPHSSLFYAGQHE
jgi:hypothetical protein